MKERAQEKPAVEAGAWIDYPMPVDGRGKEERLAELYRRHKLVIGDYADLTMTDLYPVKALRDSLDTKDDPNRSRLFHSPEGHTWTLEGAVDKDLVIALEKTFFYGTKKDADFQRMKAYNFLSPMKNVYPFYFRDTVFSIAYEKYAASGGEKGIVKAIAGVLWVIRHLYNYGFSVRFALDRLQGLHKTNRSVSDFRSTHIDDMILTNEQQTEYAESYGVAQSDYTAPVGEGINPTAQKKPAVFVSLDQALYHAVYDYITGLPVLVQSRLRRKAGEGFVAFTATNDSNSAAQKYTNRFFAGFKSAGYLGRIRKAGVKAPTLTKREFLAYAYLCFYPNGVAFTTSINLKKAILSPQIAEREERPMRVELVRHYGNTPETRPVTNSVADDPVDVSVDSDYTPSWEIDKLLYGQLD